ncbi:MAG: response regulator transcription factor [Clostridium sp.]|nr:response regulator transcription factor [Clostridium sp.]
MTTIAVIDDDIYIGDLLERLLSGSGYEVLRAYSGTEAKLLLSTQKPDLILLDLMLPGLSGEEVLADISDTPVIVISAKTDIQDKVSLLRGGAADYLTKPFDTEELLARIDVQLRMRRPTKKDDTIPQQHALLCFEALTLDCDTHEVFAADASAHLTKTEYAILKLLFQNPRQIITRSLLLERISADTPDCTENSLKVHISNLRSKLRTISGKDYIEAVWGIGFQLKSEES